MATVTERRNRTRVVNAELHRVQLHFQARPGRPQAIAAKLHDLHEEGCGLVVPVELPVGMPVTVEGDFGGGGAIVAVRGMVAWCRPSDQRLYRAGISFADPLELGKEQSKESDRQRLEEIDDLYELLQLSPNADQETVQRVYRILAQRYHPDNQETGDPLIFRRILDAYKVLADPEKRAAYDAKHGRQRRLRWRIFDQGEASNGVDMEKAKRDGILGVVYTRRRNSPESPGIGIVELEEMLGVPREHLDFSLWYLREQGLIARTDSGRFMITVRGVDHAEAAGSKWLREDRLLPAASGV
ncbi:MAG: DnaJ domain-containing protein [Bryobacteraceae bacterium]